MRKRVVAPAVAAAFNLVLALPILGAATDADLQAYLEACDRNYSETHHMLGAKYRGTGYHSTVTPGTWTHGTRSSLAYAAALLKRNDPGDADRAANIIRKVISLQDTDPASRTYGIWSYVLEEPLARMAPPDWNWADFCGALLAEMLLEHPDKLAADLPTLMRASLRHAARSIRKRNVGPGYTNIAIMGGGVCAAAGELLDDDALLQYGRARLQTMVAHTAKHGSFNEYNSPTYTRVALRECDRVLNLVRDPATRAAAESLRRTAWQIIADSFHPSTRQWAGPHSRAYADTLSEKTADELAQRCPADLRPRFRKLPRDPLELVRTFIRGSSPDASTVGTTWHTADACLGSINRSMLWTQRRPVIGYWGGRGKQTAVFRIRFLHDGKDFASMGLATAQTGPRALSVVYPLKRRGDWHPSLDRPADGAFAADDFRLRYEVRGRDAAARALADRRFELAAADRRVVVHVVPGRFDGRDVTWTLGRDADRVFLDAVCYHGETRRFDFRRGPETVLAAAAELLRPDEPPTATGPTLAQTPSGTVKATWNAGPTTLTVATPRK